MSLNSDGTHTHTHWNHLWCAKTQRTPVSKQKPMRAPDGLLTCCQARAPG